MIKKSKEIRLLSRVLAIMMAVCLVFSMAVTAKADTANEAVTNAKNGVVQIQVWFVDPEIPAEIHLHSGTGFLINNETVITCQHVATGFPAAWYVSWAQITSEMLGMKRTAEQVKAKLQLRVSIYRDVYVTATVKTASTELDYAVLALKDSLTKRTPLAIRNSETLQQTEGVYALGFPADIGDIDDRNFYGTEDVTITTGNVNKIGAMSFKTTDGGKYDSVNCIESGAKTTAGNSGGPLVDANGNVVGISAAGNTNRNIAIASAELIKVLDALGIKYIPAGEVNTDVTSSGTESEAATVDTSDLEGAIEDAKAYKSEEYTAESFAKLTAALADAEDALDATEQNDIDTAESKLEDAINSLEAKSGMSTVVIIAIVAGAAIVILLIIIILVVALGKKKPAPAPAPAPVQRPVAPAPAQRPAVAPPVQRPAVAPPVQRPVAPAPVANAAETTVLSQDSGETTVLNQGAGETTVLSQVVNGGAIVRTSNNERIPITSAEFTIGRERKSVDYCVGGNTNVSRVHARFVVRDDKTYIVDNKAANGTFVNGVKARAGQEIELKNGDKILLADEAFEFNK